MPAAEARAFVGGAVAIGAVIAHGNGITPQHRTCRTRCRVGIFFREHVLTYHPPRLADVKLRREMAAAGKLVLAPAPLAHFVAKSNGHSGVVLQKVQQPNIPRRCSSQIWRRTAASPSGQARFLPGSDRRTRPRDTSLMSDLPFGNRGSCAL